MRAVLNNEREESRDSGLGIGLKLRQKRREDLGYLIGHIFNNGKQRLADGAGEEGLTTEAPSFLAFE